MSSDRPLSFSSILRFWLPLSLTWQMMAVEGPVVTGVISRLGDAQTNLAAFGVAFAWALIIESPVIPLLSASSALTKDPTSFVLLRRFMWHVNLVSTVLQILFVLPPVFDFFAGTLLNLPNEVAVRAHEASIIMLPWSAAIGYRRFYQGVMIRGGMPKRVALGTVVRVVSMICTALFLYHVGTIPGASVACATLVVAVVAEAIASRVMVGPALAKVLAEEPSTTPMSYRALLRFYVPLMMTVLIGLGIQPLTTLALGHSPLPFESLATLPVVNSLTVFVFISVLAVQETTIVLVGDGLEHTKELRNFSWILGGLLTIVLTAIACTTMGTMWFTRIAELPVALVPLALAAAQMACVTPLLRSWESYLRALMVKGHDTGIVTGIAVAEFVTMAISLFVLTQLFGVVGVIAAPLSVAAAAACAVLLLVLASGRVLGRTAAGSR